MRNQEVRAFYHGTITPEQREVARMNHPLLKFYEGKERDQMKREGMTDRECDERIHLRMMLHPDPRIARLATPTMKLSADEINSVLRETRGLLL
ncbi:hypothetical protein PGH26_13645 [Sporosarcina jeotgali]|uniref:Uncharacterized protein n=1 Tax=Sporosarcina jeotgali TaxID=3020056 RepID=A0ABZ0KWF6_9BACL|nr:hypothetical protein [Sporosarcina sp. B2O-1]WOV83908.1 hypothetical protein PGH26_13645 [Sporosarcina sp. B2O-1]